VHARLVLDCVREEGWVLERARSEIVAALDGSEAKIVIDTDPAVPHAWCLGHSEAVVQRAFLPFLTVLEPNSPSPKT
jgi:hypothetical protein